METFSNSINRHKQEAGKVIACPLFSLMFSSVEDPYCVAWALSIVSVEECVTQLVGEGKTLPSCGDISPEPYQISMLARD
jgi:hypothetical protein